MKIQKPVIVYTGILVFCAAAIVGWKTGNLSSADTQPGTTQAKPPQHSGSASNPLMRHLRSQRTEGDRMRSAIEMARTLPSSEIKEWLDQGRFNLRKGYAMTLFQKIAFERWSKEEPAEFLVWASTNASSQYQAYISDLVKNQPGAVGQALASLEKMEEREVLIRLIANDDPDLALAELRKLLSSPESTTYGFHNAFQSLAEHRLEELEIILGEIKGSARSSLEQIVISKKLEKDFEGTLNELFQMPNGFEHVLGRYSYNNRRNMKDETLFAKISEFPDIWKEKAVRSPHRLLQGIKSVEQFASLDWENMGFSSEQADKLRFKYFHYAVQSKPAEIIAAMGDYEFSESEKRQIFQATFYRSRTEEDLANFSNSLNNPEDRTLFEELAKNKAIAGTTNPSKVQINTPDQLVEALADRKVTNLSSLMRTWPAEQKEELTATYRKLEGAEKNYLAALAVGEHSGIPTDLRNEALEHLLTLPKDHEFSKWRGADDGNAVTVVSQNALNLMKTDPGEATTWLAGLPDSPVRLQAQKNLAINWRNYEPEATKQWISTLPKNEQTEINKFLEKHRAP